MKSEPRTPESRALQDRKETCVEEASEDWPPHPPGRDAPVLLKEWRSLSSSGRVRLQQKTPREQKFHSQLLIAGEDREQC